MPNWIVRINGKTDKDLGLHVTGAGDIWSPPSTVRSETPAPGILGVKPGRRATGAAKRIPVQFDLPATVAGRRDALDALLYHLDGLLEIEWSDAPGRFQRAKIEEAEIRGTFERISYVEGNLTISFDLVLYSPHAGSVQPTVLPVGPTPVAVPIGTAPCHTTVRLRGPATDPVVRYRGLSGRILSALALEGSIASGQSVEVRSQTRQILVYDAAGVGTMRMDLYDSGAWPILDPGDGHPDAPPTIEATAQGHIIYRRAWR